jgi:O-methyltransferase
VRLRVRERWRVVPGSRIERLPTPLRPLAIFVRNQKLDRRYVHVADGFATTHYCPFLTDREFDSLYWEMASAWYPGADIRWRMWLLTAIAQQCQHLPGNFAEFGVWRGGCAFMILSRTELADDRRFFLFDTFSGIPSDRLTAHERKDGFAGRLANTSVDYVEDLLAPWQSVYEICPGDVFETLPATDVGALSFAHIDLNAVAPTQFALEYAYARMVSGGMIVFDDYGGAGFDDQRMMIDAFFSGMPEKPIALPTSQALVIKQ